MTLRLASPHTSPLDLCNRTAQVAKPDTDGWVPPVSHSAHAL
jgi:hypothetical protein